MKLRATLTLDYEIDDETAQTNYYTTDPSECAKIDQENFNDDPGIFLHFADGDITAKVEVIA